MLDLVLLRHGQSTWNEENRFTGWQDVDLTAKGEGESATAGRLMAEVEDLDLRSVHTSLLTRAIRSANLALDAAELAWLPVRRDWRLNERHYGDLEGKNKTEVGDVHGHAQVKIWRRSYDTPPPPLPPADSRRAEGDPRYRDVPAATIPSTECLADVVRRVLPYWEDIVIPDLRGVGKEGGAVLLVAHGNSIRALRKHLDGISDTDIVGLDIPTGFPYRYRLSDDLAVEDAGYLGDPDAARAAAEAVARQAEHN